MRTLAENSSPPHSPVLCTKAAHVQSPISHARDQQLTTSNHPFPFVPLCLRASVVNSPTSHLFPPKSPAIPPFPPNPTSLFSVPLLILHFEFSTLNFFTSHQNVDSFGQYALSSAKSKIPTLKFRTEREPSRTGGAEAASAVAKIGLSLQKNNSTFCPLRALGLSSVSSVEEDASVLKGELFPSTFQNVDSGISHLFSSKTPAIPAFSPNSTWLSLQKNNFPPPFQKNVDSTLVALPKFQRKPVDPRKFMSQHSAQTLCLSLSSVSSVEEDVSAVGFAHLQNVDSRFPPFPHVQNVPATEHGQLPSDKRKNVDKHQSQAHNNAFQRFPMPSLMTQYTRREMLRLSAAAVAAGTTVGTVNAQNDTPTSETGPIKTRMFWTWDHSTEWALNRPGAQTMGALNPYMRDRAAFEADYSRLIQWCGDHHIDAVVIWGLLRDVHGGTDSAKKLCDLAAKHNVRVLSGIGLCAYGGVYYEGPSPWSMAKHLEKHPELYALNAKGEQMRWNYHACPSKKETQDYVARSCEWLFKTLPTLGGVQMETGDTGVCHCAQCKERRKYDAAGFSWEDMALMYPIATDAIRSVSPKAMIVCETYTNPEPYPDPKKQGSFGEGRPSWADECLDRFPRDVFVQWVCDQFVHPYVKKSGLKWTKAGSVSNKDRRNIMRAHFATYWMGRRNELSVDWIAEMIQKSMAANFDAISLFGEMSPVNSGPELNYLALENYGSADNPKADLNLFLEKVAAPLLGGPEEAKKYLRYARLLDDDKAKIPEALTDIYAQCGKFPPKIAHRWAWLGEYLNSFREGA
jgi:hypothetical protein